MPLHEASFEPRVGGDRQRDIFPLSLGFGGGEPDAGRRVGRRSARRVARRRCEDTLAQEAVASLNSLAGQDCGGPGEGHFRGPTSRWLEESSSIHVGKRGLLPCVLLFVKRACPPCCSGM